MVEGKLSLAKAKWALVADDERDPRRSAVFEKYWNLLPHDINRQEAFACVAMLESGIFNFSPSQLSQVMAVSSEDSLYIATPLLCDPATDMKPYDLRRVMGNIGRAGLALLIPPQRPQIRKPEIEQWNVINHEPFEGQLEDCFAATSLHLGFSGYERPMSTEEHGGRFIESFFIETLMAVHDRGKRVADLDVLFALELSKLYPLVRRPDCESKPAGHKPNFDLTAIDSWEELIEPPQGAGVIRAHGNWQARLAAAAVSIMLGYRTILFQGHGCWGCGQALYDHLRKRDTQNSGTDKDAAQTSGDGITDGAMFIL